MNRPPDTPPPSRSLLIAAIAAVFLGAVDLSVIATVLPDMIVDLGINTADIDRFIWVVTGYLIAYVAAIPFAGMLSDAIGRRATLLVSLAIFTAGSIICATAGDLTQLVIGRVIQGAGGGGLLPVTIALAGAVRENRARTRTIGRVAAVDMFGWLFGPTYGAIVVHLPASIDDPWRWIFWLNVPLTIAVIIPILHETDPWCRNPARPRADWIGATLLVSAITVISIGITSSGEAGTMTTGLRAFGGTPNPFAKHLPVLLAGGAALLVLFLIRQRMATQPVVPRFVVTRPGGVASLLANAAIGTVMMITVVNVPVVVALTESGEDVSTVSAILLATFTGSIVIAALAADVVDSLVSRNVVTTSAASAAAIGMALAFPLLESQQPLRVIPALLLAGIGIGTLLAPMTNVAILGVERANTGVSVSLVLLARLLGMTIGVSALTAIGIHRLQTLTSRLDPITQGTEESTASFLARQQAFVIDHAIPLAVQVVQETFVIGAILAILAIVPLARLPDSGRPERGDRLGE